jgi:hypothetical protein
MMVLTKWHAETNAIAGPSKAGQMQISKQLLIVVMTDQWERVYRVTGRLQAMPHALDLALGLAFVGIRSE